MSIGQLCVVNTSASSYSLSITLPSTPRCLSNGAPKQTLVDKRTPGNYIPLHCLLKWMENRRASQSHYYGTQQTKIERLSSKRVEDRIQDPLATSVVDSNSPSAGSLPQLRDSKFLGHGCQSSSPPSVWCPSGYGSCPFHDTHARSVLKNGHCCGSILRKISTTRISGFQFSPIFEPMCYRVTISYIYMKSL